MTQTAGVFVRLPLDEAQIMKLYNPKKSGNENLLAIGTPVPGGDLEVVAYDNIASGHLSRVRPCGPNINLVRQPDAQAKIMVLEAEVVRLRGIINTLSSKISECGSEGYDLSGADCVDLLNDAGLIEWGTFDPEVHESSMFDGCEPGDPIWTLKGGAA